MWWRLNSQNSIQIYILQSNTIHPHPLNIYPPNTCTVDHVISIFLYFILILFRYWNKQKQTRKQIWNSFIGKSNSDFKSILFMWYIRYGETPIPNDMLYTYLQQQPWKFVLNADLDLYNDDGFDSREKVESELHT
jgi:hypothetical protein